MTLRSTKWTMGPTDLSGTPIPKHLAGHTGVILMPAVVDSKVGQEVLIFIFDPSLNKKEMAKLDGLRVDLAAGMVEVPAGPVGYVLYVIPNPTGNAEPFRAYEQLFDPSDAQHLYPYEALAEQSHWHYVVVGRGLKILDVVEFENRFSLGRILPEIKEKAKSVAGSGFAIARAQVAQQFTLPELWNHSVVNKASSVPSSGDDVLDLGGPLWLTVEREEVEAANIDYISVVFRALDARPDRGRSHFGTIDLTISGYDDDPRPLYLVPEVRQWFAKLIRAVPDVMFYVSTDGTTPKLIMLSLIQVEEVKGKGIRLAPDGVQRFLNFAFSGVTDRMGKVGMDAEGAESRSLTDRLVRALAP